MKLGHKSIITELERLGLRFRTISVFTEGRYTPEDGIWNYKDAILHIKHIHPLIRNVSVINHKDSLCSVYIQKIFGMDFPLVAFDLEPAPYEQISISSLFAFVLIIHNICAEVRPGITRVTTNYHIGASPLLSLLSPLVGWLLKRNYKALTAADIPLRERRGELRSWGYDFAISDYTTVESRNSKNVLITAAIAAPPAEEITLPPEMKEGDSITWGRADHFGLRLLRAGDALLIYPRMCPHEGAVLDRADCGGNRLLSCPWHGLRIAPIARIDVFTSLKEKREFDCDHHRFTFSDGRLLIEPKA